MKFYDQNTFEEAIEELWEHDRNCQTLDELLGIGHVYGPRIIVIPNWNLEPVHGLSPEGPNSWPDLPDVPNVVANSTHIGGAQERLLIMTVIMPTGEMYDVFESVLEDEAFKELWEHESHCQTLDELLGIRNTYRSRMIVVPRDLEPVHGPSSEGPGSQPDLTDVLNEEADSTDDFGCLPIMTVIMPMGDMYDVFRSVL